MSADSIFDSLIFNNSEEDYNVDVEDDILNKMYDLNGFNPRGIHIKTNTELNVEGFRFDGVHHITETEWDPHGFNWIGVREDGESKEDVYRDMATEGTLNLEDPTIRVCFARCLKLTKSELDEAKAGISTKVAPVNKDIDGYYSNGINIEGFDRKGNHRHTKTKWNPAGFDREGYHQCTNAKWNFAGYSSKGIIVHREFLTAE